MNLKALQTLYEGRITHEEYKKALFVTESSGGCSIYSQGGAWKLPAERVAEVDPTGAGDTFCRSHADSDGCRSRCYGCSTGRNVPGSAMRTVSGTAISDRIERSRSLHTLFVIVFLWTSSSSSPSNN